MVVEMPLIFYIFQAPANMMFLTHVPSGSAQGTVPRAGSGSPAGHSWLLSSTPVDVSGSIFGHLKVYRK